MFSPCTRSLGTPPACCIADRRGCRKSPHPRSDQAQAIGRHLQAPGPTITIFYYQFYFFLGYRRSSRAPEARATKAFVQLALLFERLALLLAPASCSASMSTPR